MAAYSYVDEHGEVLFQTLRFAPKTFRQQRPDGHGGWARNLNGVRLVPYRLPDLMAAPVSEPVYIVEGEKDADTLRALGLIATTNPMGAKKWRAEYNAWFAGRPVVLLPDNDPVGAEHMDQVARELEAVAASVRVVRLPGITEKGDVSDWLDQGGSRVALEALTAATTPTNGPIWLQPISALLSKPELPVDWLVTDLFSVGSSGWVGAEAKVGKSWLTLELLYCLTTGSPYLGRFSVPRPRSVIYIQEEDSEQRVLRRFNKLLRGSPGRTWPPDARFRYSIRGGFKLDDPVWVARLRQALIASPVDLCVLDVFQRLHLKSENDQSQMAEVLEVLNALTREFGVGFLVVHHNRKLQAGNEARPNQMLRGSGVLAGWSECSLYCRKGNSKSRLLVTPESKDAPEMDEFMVVLEDTPNGGIRLITAETNHTERLMTQAAKVLEIVQRLERESADVTSRRVAELVGWSRTSAYRVLEHLVDRGELEADEAMFGKTTVKLYRLPREGG